MFDIGWSELLIIGVITLLVVGPKDLPVFLRTVGRYFGAIKKQAAEFRTQFDEALRETELDQLRKDVVSMKTEVETSVRQVTRQVEDDIAETKRAVEGKPKSPETSTEAKTSASQTPQDEAPAAASSGTAAGGNQAAPAPAPAAPPPASPPTKAEA